MKYKGVVHGHLNDYTMPQRLHMIDFIADRGANLCIWNRLSWETSYQSVDNKTISEINVFADKANQRGVELWIGMKPGDFRYCMHKEDRDLYIKNAKSILNQGAKGIYVLMDDTHPGGDARVKDAEFQANLISELHEKIGSSLKGICGERYHTKEMLNHEYYEPILKVLPKNNFITWTGPRIWNKELKGEDMINSDWPIMIWDNYFASDSPDPERAPSYPFEGRDANLLDKIGAFVLNMNCHYPWQFGAMHTTLDFLNMPHNYNSKESFEKITKFLGGDPSNKDKKEFLRLGDEYWKKESRHYELLMSVF